MLNYDSVPQDLFGLENEISRPLSQKKTIAIIIPSSPSFFQPPTLPTPPPIIPHSLITLYAML